MSQWLLVKFLSRGAAKLNRTGTLMLKNRLKTDEILKVTTGRKIIDYQKKSIVGGTTRNPVHGLMQLYTLMQLLTKYELNVSISMDYINLRFLHYGKNYY